MFDDSFEVCFGRANAGLAKLAELSDVVTYELEQLAADTLRWLMARVPVAPSVRILEVAQDRVREKTFLCCTKALNILTRVQCSYCRDCT